MRGDSRADGSYRLRAAMRAPGQIVARAAGSESAPVELRIKPAFSVQFSGARVLGGSLRVTGRVRPAGAGDLVLSIRGAHRRIDPGADGRFRSAVPTRQPGRVRVSFALDAAPGYAKRSAVDYCAGPGTGACEAGHTGLRCVSSNGASGSFTTRSAA